MEYTINSYPYEKTKIFIEKAKKVHGDKYNYSKVEYINAKIKIRILCKEHGEFLQIPNSHLQGNGCSKCSSYKRSLLYKSNNKDFIEKANQIHNNKYDYSLVDYKNNYTKVKIICKEHGVFEQVPTSHLRSCGCPHCKGNITFTSKDFIRKAKQIHENTYNYSLINYKNYCTKVKIICSIHGVFEQSPNIHLKGGGCPKCAYGSNTKEFIEKAKKIHGDTYDYSKVNYREVFKKIIIICPIHGEFEQTPNSHLKKSNCPKCKSSKGEKSVRKYLQENTIEFKEQKIFEKCVYKRPLKYDFYLPSYNLCIEFDGEQHYKFIPHFHKTIEKFQEKQLLDKIKTKFCQDNNINLLRIRYDENVEEKLHNYIYYGYTKKNNS